MINQQALDYEQKALDTIESLKELLSLDKLLSDFNENQNLSSGVIPWENTTISLPAINNGNQKRQRTELNRSNDCMLIDIPFYWLKNGKHAAEKAAIIKTLFTNHEGDNK